MGKFYPVEMRERAVAAVIVEELPRDEVARLFAVGIATLDRWLFLWRSGQDLVANLGKPGPARRWDEAALSRLQRQVAATPDARLGDHVQAWKQAGGRALSETTLWRGLRQLGWTRKKSTLSTPGATQPSGRRGGPSTPG